WVGRTERAQRKAVPSKRARCRSTLPSSTRPPPQRRLERRSERLTTRPDREPGLTGPSFAEVSPPLFEWPRTRERIRIGTGRGLVPGTAALLCGARPPESA